MKQLLNLVFLCCAKDMLCFYALEFSMFMSGGYWSSLNIFGLHIPYKEMQHDTRCCTFGLFDVYGKILLRFVKNTTLIISVQNVGLFSEPHAVQLKLSWVMNCSFLQYKHKLYIGIAHPCNQLLPHRRGGQGYKLLQAHLWICMCCFHLQC